MAKLKMPPSLPPEEEAELERRAYRLLRLYGKKDPDAVSLWRLHSFIYTFNRVMLVSNLHAIEVRVAGEPDKRGIQCYSLAYGKRKADNHVTSNLAKGRIALERIPRRMVLDDLADV